MHCVRAALGFAIALWPDHVLASLSLGVDCQHCVRSARAMINVRIHTHESQGSKFAITNSSHNGRIGTSGNGILVGSHIHKQTSTPETPTTEIKMKMTIKMTSCIVATEIKSIIFNELQKMS